MPKLASGPFIGYPRVFGIAWAFVAHTDSHFEPETLRRFVRAYQTVQPLTIGELWAVAITLRIVLVENLRRAAHLIVSGRAARQEADDIADRLLGVNGDTAEPDALIKRYGDRADSDPVLRRPARAAAARPGSKRHPGGDVAGGAARGAGNDGGGGRAR